MRYIGLDIGDGESAAALVSGSHHLLPIVLTIGQEKSVLSVVGKLNDSPVVGRFAKEGMNVTDISVRFKSRFLTDPDRNDIKRFMKGVYIAMSKTAQEALSEPVDDVVVALGRPAGWDKNSCDQYAQLAKDAGFPNVYTVSESRAAFLFAHYANTLKLNPDELKKPCLVIDIGSSTTDFAYVVDGQESGESIFGQNHLGGGLIDKLIVEYGISLLPNEKKQLLEKIFNEKPTWYNKSELYARGVKEKYFTQEASGVEPSEDYKDKIHRYTNNPIFIEFELNKEVMHKLLFKTKLPELNGTTFAEALEYTLKTAKKIADTNTPPELLILTGGASRMKIFRDCCKEIFPKARIYTCPDPEFSIARGLSIASCIDHQLASLREEIKAFVKSDALKRDVMKNIAELKKDLIPQIAGIVLEHGFTPAIKYALQEKDFSTQNLLDNAVAYTQKYISDSEATDSLKDGIEKTAKKWVKEKLVNTQNDIDRMCEKYPIVNPAKLNLSSLPINFQQLDLSQVNLPLLFKGVLKINDWLGFDLNNDGVTFKFLMRCLNNKSYREKLQGKILESLLGSDGLATVLCLHLADELSKKLEQNIQEAEIVLH